MHNRLRLLRLGTALLYFGPLLAGLVGQGWAMVPVFVAIFLLWSVILRPHLWPGSLADFARNGAAVALASLVATQILLVVLCFGIGRGIGGVLNLKPALSYFLPATISFLSVPFSRLIWNPRVAADNVGFDPILHDLAPVPFDCRGMADDMLAQVFALPDDVPEEELQQHLSAISAHLDPVVIRQGLGDVVASGKATRAGVKALIVHATDPAVVPLLAGSGYPAQAFSAAGRDGELLNLFATRCDLAVKDEPHVVVDCPSPDAILRASQSVGEPAAAALVRLAGLLTQNAGSV